MRKYTILFLLYINVSSYAQEFELRNGDIIFQESCPADRENSIKQVTTSIGDYEFTHVGMVYIDQAGRIFVLEATVPKVTLTPIEGYLRPEKAKGCYPVSVVGRLKEKYRALIPDALKTGLGLIGRDYDYGFILGNDSYYCSELIYEILRKANNGKEVFPLNTMTFKSKETELTAKGWIEYFRKHKLPIPEGEKGINPGAMSRSDVIDIVYSY